MTNRSVQSAALAVFAVAIAGCGSFGTAPEYGTLAEALDTVEVLLLDELEATFGTFTVVEERVSVAQCEPLQTVRASVSRSVRVDGVSQAHAYDSFIGDRRGLFETGTEVGDRSAGFDLEGVAGGAGVFDYEDEQLRVTATTGCYSEDEWGVADPWELER